MAGHIAAIRALLLGCTLCVHPLLADAQSSEHSRQFHEHSEQLRAELLARVSDPQQRSQLMAERIEQQRIANPDLANVLRLDASTGDKLLSLLADQQLSRELEPPAATPRDDGELYNSTRGWAARYTQNMNEISKLIGTAGLDDYVDYRRKHSSRYGVITFDEILPVDGKLTLNQRNALTDLFEDQGYPPNRATLGFAYELPLESKMTDDEAERWMDIQDLAVSERYTDITESADRELVERAAAILTPQQTKVLADWKRREVGQRRAWAQAQRQALDLAPDEKLADPQPGAQPISKTLRLTISLTVNDTLVVKQLTSVRGGSVSFDAPEGLIAEVRPHMDQRGLNTEVKLYEKVRGGRRVIGQRSGDVYLIKADKTRVYSGGRTNMAQGRKAYAFQWDISGTQL